MCCEGRYSSTTDITYTQFHDVRSIKDVEVEALVELKAPEERKAIIDPVKEYFEKAGITQLVVKDDKLHATWTYSVAKPAAGADGAAPAAPTE